MKHHIKLKLTKKITTLSLVLFAAFAAIVSLSLASPSVHAAGTATLSLSPSRQTVSTGSNLTLTVYVNPSGSSINTVQSQLTYPSANFSFVSETPAGSFTANASPAAITSSGTVTFAAGTTTPVSGSSSVAVASIVLKANTAGASLPINLASVCAAGNYALTCSAAYDSSTSVNDLSTVTGGSYTVASNTSPTVSLTANPTTINSGSSSTLTWSSANATSCSATTPSGWTSSTATSGTQSVSPTSTTTYTITCTGTGGSTPASATVTVSGVAGCKTSSTTWQNTSFAPQTGNFTFDFDATPSAVNINTVIGLSNNAATAYSSLATIARFNPTGTIDAVNDTGQTSGGNYTAVNQLAYTANTSYHFKMTVNPTAHTYSMVVTSSGGSATIIATNYGFRYDQRTLSTFNNWATYSLTGSAQVCNAVIAAADSTPPTTSITAPANNATVSGSNVTISANASDNVGVTKVEFYVNGVLLASVNGAGPYSTPWNTTALTNGSYALTTKAYDAAGNVGTSSTVTVTVNNPDTTPPSVPTGLTATAASSTKVNLSWAASTDSGLNASGMDHYVVERGGVAIANVAAPATTYSDTTVAASTTYSYNVVAVDKAGNASAQSNTATVTTPSAGDTTPPSAPSNLTGTAISYTQVNLTWGASTDTGGSGLAGYRVFRNSTQIAQLSASTLTYGDATAAAGTTYSYYVVAYDGATPPNVSANSNTASVTTPHSLWNAATNPGNTNAYDGKSLELGMRFQSSVAGTVTGVSFYKGTKDTGTHTGTLWNSTGTTKLASVSFTGETASGWQKATFSSPVAITAGTTYVVSYYSPTGYYAWNEPYFNVAHTSATPSSGTITGLQDTSSSHNGLYVYSSDIFPTNSYNSSNYWVDVIVK